MTNEEVIGDKVMVVFHRGEENQNISLISPYLFANSKKVIFDTRVVEENIKAMSVTSHNNFLEVNQDTCLEVVEVSEKYEEELCCNDLFKSGRTHLEEGGVNEILGPLIPNPTTKGPIYFDEACLTVREVKPKRKKVREVRDFGKKGEIKPS